MVIAEYHNVNLQYRKILKSLTSVLNSCLWVSLHPHMKCCVDSFLMYVQNKTEEITSKNYMPKNIHKHLNMSDKVTDSFNCNMRVLVLHIFVLDFHKLPVFPSSCIKWHSHSLQLTKGPAGSWVEKTQTESSMWCQYFIVVTYPADRKWQFAQAYEWRYCTCC